MKAILIRSIAVLLVIYVVAVAGLAIAMLQPPETFGRVMSYAPAASYIVLPFETLWTWARAGELRPGDPAPDFLLKTVDGTEEMRLSSFRDVKPVALVFGSYT